MLIEHPRVSSLRVVVLQMIVVVLSLLAPSTTPQSAGASDAAAMQQLKKSLKLPSTVDWSDSDPCKWQSVGCESGQVTRIQLKSLNMTGTLSASIANLTNLKVLELMENELSGPLPSLKGLGSLQTINLHHNQFSSIPDDFFDELNSLQEVYLDNNPFSAWSIPKGLSASSSLKNFSATSANVGGILPDIFSPNNFPSMIHLHLSFNNLTGGLPSSFAGLGLQSLWLNGQMNNGERSLNGTIEVLKNMTQLVQIWINMNAFSGPIPDLSGLDNLADLNLRDNSLTGPVPASLTKLSSLKTVNLTNNLLQGPPPKFPNTVGVDMLPGLNSFCVSEPGGDCDSRVNALISVMEPFGYPAQFAQEWKGNDPCASWLGITCSQKNITIINLQNRGLTGTISPNFSVLTSVQTLILARNNITGTIPDALTKMPNLRTLDVSNNNLYGKVPTFGRAAVNVRGNVNIGKDDPGPSAGGSSGGPGGPGAKTDRKSRVGVVVGSVLGSVFLVSAAGLLLFCFVRRKKRYGRVQQPNTMVIHPNHSGSDDAVKITIAGSGGLGKPVSEDQSQGSTGTGDVHVIETNNMIISIQVLRDVTNNFSDQNILGRGGFGTVYKGKLPDGTQIAVKRMNSGILGDKGLAEFKSEIAVLSKVRHRHLVALLGFCLDGNEKLLVYEYLPQGALSRYLFDYKDEGLDPLKWNQRLTVALDVARGVEYLHSLAQQSFIHRDLKPSNILLGDDMRAKVADFGLVRLAPDGKTSIETRLAGTFGYLAPEYAVMGRITTKVDVFSFGVILMEMVTGRKALDETQPEDSVHLVTWFRRAYVNKDSFHKAIDPTIERDDETLASVNTVAELAGHCCAREPQQRPEMGHVVNVLSSLMDVWKPSEESSEDLYGIDLGMTLPQALKKWQAFGDSNMDDSSSSSFLGSKDNTQTSIPTRPSGFAESFTSVDGR